MTTAPATLNPYAKYLGDRHPIAVLEASADRLKEVAGKIGTERIGTAPAPGKWSAAEILCHLADCEIAFGFRLRQTLAEDHHVIQPFDQEKWAAPYGGFSADLALATFAALRKWNLLVIEGGLKEFAAKPVTHPERGSMTFANIVETMAGHDLNHIGQLEAIAG